MLVGLQERDGCEDENQSDDDGYDERAGWFAASDGRLRCRLRVVAAVRLREWVGCGGDWDGR